MTVMKEAENGTFRFKQFTIWQDKCAMKVNTDGVLLGAWADIAGVTRALDIGAGTGVIAIMLAQRTTATQIDAVEIDPNSCVQARQNIGAAPWADRLQLIEGPVQDWARKAQLTYDLIVSNPPFFSGGVLSDNQARNEVRHTIKLSHGDLLISVQKLLAPHGRFCVILPRIEGLRFQELAQSYHLYPTRIMEVVSRPGRPPERLLIQFEREAYPQQREQILLREADSEAWSDSYRELTGDFYLNL